MTDLLQASVKPITIQSRQNWTSSSRRRLAQILSLYVSVHALIPCKGNITLDDVMCPNAKGDKEAKKWLEVYAGSIKKRLNAAAPGAHLKKKDTHSLMSLCAFHSLVLMAPSPFCGLFSAEEFTEYSYHGDLAKFYTNGLAYFPSFPLSFCGQPCPPI
jgi:hypothetical protein